MISLEIAIDSETTVGALTVGAGAVVVVGVGAVGVPVFPHAVMIERDATKAP
jgi:hypothetical protein